MGIQGHGDGEDVWIETDHFGLIVGCSRAALEMINYSEQGARGQALLQLFVTNQPGPYQFGRVMAGHAVTSDALFRPRERRAFLLRYRMELAPRSTVDDPVLRWTFERLEDSTQM